MSKAYLAGNVNQALVDREDGLCVLDGRTGSASRVDSYVFSQWRLSRQELKEIEVQDEAEIFEQLYIESEKATALQEALELMDPSLSEKYRQVIAQLLTARIGVHAGLLDHLRNRFYSNKLPESFDEYLAIQAIEKLDSSLVDIYRDLRIKTSVFDIFYTKFWMLVPLLEPERKLVDEHLTNCSAFAHFTNALYVDSITLYDYAWSIAVKTIDDYDLPISSEVFSDLKLRLIESGKFKLKDIRPFERLLREQMLINVKHYHFFGSSVKTIYNYSAGLIPFSTEQTVQVLLHTHSPFLHDGLHEDELQKKLYWQSMNDLDFFSWVGEHGTWQKNVQEPKISKVQECVKSVDRHYLNTRFRLNVPTARLENYKALLFADCAFMMQDYSDAVMLYSDLKAYVVRSRKNRPLYEHTILESIIMVRLGKSYEMLHQFKKAKNFYLKAFRRVDAYIKDYDSVKLTNYQDSESADDFSLEPSNIAYAEAVADKLAGCFIFGEIGSH